MQVRYLNIGDVQAAYRLFSRAGGDAIGQVFTKALIKQTQKRQLLGVFEDGKLVGVCDFNRKRTGETVIYEIVVDKEYRRRGYGREMIKRLIDEGRVVVLKCPEELEANNFYKKIGGRLLRQEKGKKRRLNVWGISWRDFYGKS